MLINDGGNFNNNRVGLYKTSANQFGISMISNNITYRWELRTDGHIYFNDNRLI